MTISNQDALVRYIGDGVVTEFPFPFLIPEGALLVETFNGTTVSVLSSANYTVAGFDDPNGGTVTLNTALANGHEIYISRNLDFVQEFSIANQQRFYANVVEGAFDYLTMLAQELKERVDRSILARPGVDTTQFVSDLFEAASDAETSATAAAASASDASDSEVAAAASAAEAALYDGPWLDDVAALLADTSLTYTAEQPGTVVAGDYVRTRAEGFSYEVAASGATDHHVTTAGGVKFYVVPLDGSRISPRQFGGVGDGVADDTLAIAAMLRVFEGAQGIVFDFTGGTWLIDSLASGGSFEWANTTYPASGLLTFNDSRGTDYSGFSSIKRPLAFGLTNCEFRGFGSKVLLSPSWDGGTGTDWALLSFANCRGIKVHGFEFDGNRPNLTTDSTRQNNHNIYMICENYEFDITGNWFKNSGDNDSGSFDLAGDGIYLADSGAENIKIRDNFFINSGRWGVAIERGNKGDMRRIRITGNTFREMVLGSIDLETRGDMTDIFISGNNFIGRSAISVGGFKNEATTRFITDLRIVGNTFDRASGSSLYSYGVFISGGDEGSQTYLVTRGFTFSNNVVRRLDADRNFLLIEKGRHEDLTIKGNTLRALTKNNNTRCIQMFGCSLAGMIDISDNDIAGWGEPVFIMSLTWDTSSPEFNMSITDNTFKNTNRAMNLNFPTDAGQYAASLLLLKGNTGSVFGTTALAMALGNVAVSAYDRHLINAGTSAALGVRRDGYGLRVYADNGAAITAGLVVGETYRTETGEMRVVV